MTIRDSIRDAAINWPDKSVLIVESGILYEFTEHGERLLPALYGNEIMKTQARVFMLLVAEAL